MLSRCIFFEVFLKVSQCIKPHAHNPTQNLSPSRPEPSRTIHHTKTQFHPMPADRGPSHGPSVARAGHIWNLDMCDMSGTEQGGLLVTRAAVLRVWVVVLLLSALSCLVAILVSCVLLACLLEERSWSDRCAFQEKTQQKSSKRYSFISLFYLFR